MTIVNKSARVLLNEQKEAEAEAKAKAEKKTTKTTKSE